MSQLARSQVSQHETRAFEVQRGLQRWGCRLQGENDVFWGVYLPHTRWTNRNCTNLGVLPNSLKTRPTKMFIEFVSLSASRHGDLVRQLMFEQIKWKGISLKHAPQSPYRKKKNKTAGGNNNSDSAYSEHDVILMELVVFPSFKFSEWLHIPWTHEAQGVWGICLRFGSLRFGALMDVDRPWDRVPWFALIHQTYLYITKNTVKITHTYTYTWWKETCSPPHSTYWHGFNHWGQVHESYVDNFLNFVGEETATCTNNTITLTTCYNSFSASTQSLFQQKTAAESFTIASLHLSSLTSFIMILAWDSKLTPNPSYGWWKKSRASWEMWNPVNNGIFTISAGDRRISFINSIPQFLARPWFKTRVVFPEK